MSFDRFMAQALYAPGWGYYSNDQIKLGKSPAEGSDFVTAPELSPFFGHALAVQIQQALEATQTEEIWEFGAGSGALAEQLLQRLGSRVQRYHIVELSAHLRQRQQERLREYAHRLHWHDSWPQSLQGVVIGNEVLDAMPVKLLYRQQGQWHERHVRCTPQTLDPATPASERPNGCSDPRGPTPVLFDPLSRLEWVDQETALRPPMEIAGEHDYLTEIHPQAEAFVQSLAERLQRGAAFFIDYGFAEGEYYHPQRHMGTLMCHRAHQSDTDPLIDVGRKDISAHVNFSGLALAAQNAGLQLLGYASQGRFLLNCGLLQALEHASLSERVMAQKLVTEHEMGELFKVIAWAPAHTADGFEALGFAQGDRSHTL